MKYLEQFSSYRVDSKLLLSNSKVTVPVFCMSSNNSLCLCSFMKISWTVFKLLRGHKIIILEFQRGITPKM